MNVNGAELQGGRGRGSVRLGAPYLEAGSGIQELDSSRAEGTTELQQRQINGAKIPAVEAEDGVGPHLSFYSQKEAEKRDQNQLLPLSGFMTDQQHAWHQSRAKVPAFLEMCVQAATKR